MAHLTCFAGGMIAMSAHVDPAISEEKRAHLMEVRNSGSGVFTRGDKVILGPFCT